MGKTRFQFGLATAISKKDFDLDYFVQLAILDEHVREEIIHLLIHDPDIMVYYHCYTILDRASQEQPALFYPHWDKFTPLLHHPNSYHRDFGITLCANLTAADQPNRFGSIFDEYFACLYDRKFMTACCCVSHSLIIMRNLPQLRDAIMVRLLEIDRQCDYPPKQKALLKCAVLEVFEQVYAEQENTAPLNTFILESLNSLSPKTRRKAGELSRKYQII
jgi:hypothetical protein